MGSVHALMVLATLSAAPNVEVATLTGQQHAGTLMELSAETAVVKTDAAEPVKIPLKNLLEVRLTDKAGASQAAPFQLDLKDGSRFGLKNLTVIGEEATATSPQLGAVKLPAATLSAVRFSPLDSKVTQRWNELRSSAPQRDMLIIRKGDVLDKIQGVVGDITTEQVLFLLGNREVPVGRDKVFGVVYGRRDVENASKPICNLQLTGGDEILVQSVSWSGEHWQLQMLSGAKATVAASGLRALDFSLGKVQYLSALEPRKLEYTQFIGGKPSFFLGEWIWRMRRDRGLEGQPIRIKDRTFARGLSLHSKTVVAYRLGKDYRRLKGVMGIDAIRAQGGLGDVQVTMTGDGKTLLQTRVVCTDDPRELDIDVSNVVMLEITVDFGEGTDTGDHLALGDIRVIK